MLPRAGTPSGRAGVVLAAAALGLAAAAVVGTRAPAPAADVARGSEGAFVSGLHPRELPPGRPPQRWSTPRARVRFRHLSSGPATLSVRLHGHRTAVLVAADGAVVGTLAPGETARDLPVSVGSRGWLDVELSTDGFTAADGRRLGALLDRVALTPARRGVPRAGVWLAFLVPAVAAAYGATACGLSALGSLAASTAVTALLAALLWPSGLFASPYALAGPRLAVLAIVGSVLFGRLQGGREPAAARWAFAAALAAALVQGVAATWPGMVVSDAVFHANKLSGVASGDFFPTSQTQHARPFRFPYGVSFYLLLAPFARLGLDPVGLVRGGAALAGVAGSLLLFRAALPAGAARAAVAVVILQTLPITFDVYSYGNLSNVFGQAATLLFFAWWLGAVGGGWAVGAAGLALGALAHFSSLIVLGAMAAALLVLDRERARPRDVKVALVVGALVSVAYYARFWPLMAEQLPRLAEGGGPAGDASPLRPFAAGLGQWGAPAVALALLGTLAAPRAFDRAWAAYWAAGAALALAGAASPLEVRWAYALAAPLAVAAAGGVAALAQAGGFPRAAGSGLLVTQAVASGAHLAEALLRRYRS
jgi:hypothetical protein